MGLHSSMSAKAIRNRIERDQAPTRPSTLQEKIDTYRIAIRGMDAINYKGKAYIETTAKLELAEQEALAHEIADGPRAELERRLPIAAEIALHGDPLPYPFPATRVMFIKLLKEINKALTEPDPLDYGSAAWLAGMDDDELGEAPTDTRTNLGL